MIELRHMRWLLLGIALCLAGALAWNSSTRDAERSASVAPKRFERALPPPPTDAAIADERRAIVASLAAAPEFAGYAERLSSAYPGDWNRLLDASALRALTSRVSEAPEAFVTEAIRGLRRNRGVVATRAGAEAMTRVFDAQAALLAALSNADKRLCVDFMLGEINPAFLTFAATHRGLLAEMASSSLEAVISGESQAAAPATPTDADFDLLEAGLRQRGLDRTQIDALLDGKMPDPPISDASLCDAGLVYFDAMKALPDDARLRIYALAIKSLAKT